MKRYIVVAALAFALVMGMAIAPASAYFTDTHTANGGVAVEAGPTTHIYEWVRGTQKKLVVTNDEDSVSVIVRAKATCASFIEPELVSEESSGKWVLGTDGWYVYQEAIPGGGETEPIVINFKFDNEKIQTTTKRPPEEGNNYNVDVKYEALPATYKADGSLDFGSWM